MLLNYIFDRLKPVLIESGSDTEAKLSSTGKGNLILFSVTSA